MPGTIVVIPTYNECENIQQVVPQVLAATPCEVLVVDDESPDGTAAVVEAMGRTDPRIHLLRHSPKRGLGPAYRDGFKVAIEQYRPDLLIQMDADLSHPPSDLPKFVEQARDFDLVLGSRYSKGITVVNWPIERLLISYFGNAYCRRVLGMPIRDATGGFKCWRRELLESIGLDDVRSNGYAFQIETTYRAWRRGARIRELPITFADREVGDSKMSKRIGLEALWIVWWLRLAGALGRL